MNEVPFESAPQLQTSGGEVMKRKRRQSGEAEKRRKLLDEVVSRECAKRKRRL